GQDAVRSALAFAAKLPITGVILTKTDGDARGGAALSLATVVGKPLKFVGVGEKTKDFEVFHPDRPPGPDAPAEEAGAARLAPRAPAEGRAAQGPVEHRHPRGRDEGPRG